MLILNSDLSEELQFKLFTKLKKDKLSSSQYFLKLLKNDLVTRIDLWEGFYYDNYLEKIFNSNSNEIRITRI